MWVTRKEDTKEGKDCNMVLYPRLWEGSLWRLVEQGENFTTLQSSEPIEKISGEDRCEIYARMSSKLTPLQQFLKWSVSDRRTRTVSPFSQETISEWLENRIKEGTVEELRAALQVDPANACVTAYLGRRLADQADLLKEQRSR